MPSLWDALKQYLGDAAPGGALNPEVTPQGLLDTASLASAPVPIAGDAIGLLADAYRMRDPAERTPLNYGLMAMGVLPFVPSGLSKARKALGKADDAKRAKTAFEVAHEVAQKNAALPVSKGGLGLPPNNTAMDRARAMGYVDDTNGDLYRGLHQAPTSANIDAAAPAYALDRLYPDDVYSPMASRYYGHGADPAQDANVMRRLQALRNNPDAMVGIRRAVPKDAPIGINHGDWVTLDRKYAIEHGESALGGDYKILTDRVPAKSLWTDGNSIYEFGLDKSQRFADGPSSIPMVRSTVKANRERSRFAAFDPLFRESPDLLASVAPYAITGGLLGLLGLTPDDAQAGK